MKYLSIIISALLLASCGAKQTQPEATAAAAVETQVALTPEQLKNAQVETGQAEKSNISKTLKLNGSIDVPPQNMVSVSFPLGGYLKSSKLLPGMHVRKGEVLAIMEDAQFIQLQQDYLLTKSRLELAQAEYQRQQGLNVGKATSDKVLQQAKSELETQRITQRALGEKLRLIGINPDQLTEDNLSRSVNVHSPINGFVSKVNVNIGKYTAPTDVLFELVNPEDIHLALSVFEKDVNNLAIGQRVTAYTNGQPDKKYNAEVILVSKHLNDDRTAEVHCHFEKYDQNLIPGMFMNAEVAVKTENAWLVPEGAVVRWQNEHFIFVETGNGQFDMQKVEIGIAQDGKQQIFAQSDLSGKRLATKNAYSLLMKMKNSAEE